MFCKLFNRNPAVDMAVNIVYAEGDGFRYDRAFFQKQHFFRIIDRHRFMKLADCIDGIAVIHF